MCDWPSKTQVRIVTLSFGQTIELSAHINLYVQSERLEGVGAALTAATSHKRGGAGGLRVE